MLIKISSLYILVFEMKYELVAINSKIIDQYLLQIFLCH